MKINVLKDLVRWFFNDNPTINNIKFVCPTCGQKYVAEPDMFGTTAKCESCNKFFKIPSCGVSFLPPPAILPVKKDYKVTVAEIIEQVKQKTHQNKQKEIAKPKKSLSIINVLGLLLVALSLIIFMLAFVGTYVPTNAKQVISDLPGYCGEPIYSAGGMVINVFKDHVIMENSWIDNFNNNNLCTGDNVFIQPCHYLGTKTYDTVLGGQRTVKHFIYCDRCAKVIKDGLKSPNENPK